MAKFLRPIANMRFSNIFLDIVAGNSAHLTRRMMVKIVAGILLAAALILPAAAQQAETTDDAWRLGGVQRLEFTRYVPAGKIITLDFAYALNADCSPQEGGVEIRTTTEPSNGAVEFKPGSRFPNFAKSNVRYKCNEKKTNGTLINYKSRAGYTGTDKLEILVLYPTGYAREVEYTLNVR